jgi:hypothetical protein
MSEASSSSAWDDPNVKEALAEGSAPEDIQLLDCPACGVTSYYNQGSHFTCRVCGRGYAVLCDADESIELETTRSTLDEDADSLLADEAYSLADYTDASLGDDDAGEVCA